MKQNARPLDRVREVVNHARLLCSTPDSAPAVAHVMQTQLWEDIETDADGMKSLAMMGLNALIRSILKTHEDDGDGAARAKQLEMFPPEQRQIVADIGRNRVFVPSRDEFVALVPDAISPAETREAGRYLIAQGEDTIRRGKALCQLADMRDAP